MWQLQIAVDKCFVCNIHPGSKRSSTDLYKYVLNTLVLENVDVFRDLGVHVDCLLKFDRHISLIVHKAMTRARLILKCFLSRDRELLFKAYCVYDVRPLLEYCNCSAVWSPHFKFLVYKMESVQRFFTKRLHGMWRHAGIFSTCTKALPTCSSVLSIQPNLTLNADTGKQVICDTIIWTDLGLHCRATVLRISE